MPADDFDKIVAGLPDRRRPPGRAPLLIGVVLCLIALGMLAFGDVKGAVLAIFPWLLGMGFVLKGRG
ncbi:hypothetical protein [Actinoplanes sp. NPDC051494]|uniref:hypothetical protein n=1 Tax=Actinoplanes sp. NPDC051494 TaxID=3363907 RepID=UPI0037B34638